MTVPELKSTIATHMVQAIENTQDFVEKQHKNPDSPLTGRDIMKIFEFYKYEVIQALK